MAMEERSRRDLQRRLEEVLGEEQALTLMAGLPREEPASKADLDALELRMADRIGSVEHRLDLKVDGLDLKVEGLAERVDQGFRGLEERIDLKTESLEDRFSAALREGMAELREEMSSFRADLALQAADLRKEMAAQTRIFTFSTLGALVMVTAVALSAGRI